MRQTSKEQLPLLPLTKAYGVSYAVFRIAARIPNPAMKEHLERQALSLLDAAAVENYVWTGTVSKAIEYLVRFGSDVGIIHESNSAMIIAELSAMNAAIAGLEKPAILEPVPLEDVFAGQESLFPESPANPAKRKTAPKIRQSESADSGIRQSAILDKIRQSGNCRMKEIQEILPQLSERTLRYNLRSLMEQDLIERVGNGGPGVFYRIRQTT